MKPELFKKVFPANVRAEFSEMTMDFSLAMGASGLSAPQEDFLRNSLKVNPLKVYTMRQVHGNRVLKIEAKDIPQKENIPEADAMMTNVPGIVITMRTADCLPVFLCDPGAGSIAVVHAGWKGTAVKIVSETIKAMTREYETNPKDVLAVFGPSLRECCYEVGEEFKQTFQQEVIERSNKLCLDLPLVNRKQLLAAGVLEKNIFESKECTMCGKNFFSYRRDADRSGRHLSLMTML